MKRCGIQASIVEVAKKIVQQISQEKVSSLRADSDSPNPVTAQGGLGSGPSQLTSSCDSNSWGTLPSTQVALLGGKVDCLGTVGHAGQSNNPSGKGPSQLAITNGCATSNLPGNPQTLAPVVHSYFNVDKALLQQRRNPERLLDLEDSSSGASAFAFPGHSSHASDPGGPVSWGLQPQDATEMTGHESRRIHELLGAQLEEASASHQYLASTSFSVPAYSTCERQESEGIKDSSTSSPDWNTDSNKATEHVAAISSTVIWKENEAFADATERNARHASSIRPEIPMVGLTTLLAGNGPLQEDASQTVSKDAQGQG
jgi:hypothetical protein